MKRQLSKLVATLLIASVAGTSALADDGALVRKSLSKNSETVAPHAEAEHAFVDMMRFYAPAQAANGNVAPIEYYDVDGALVDTRTGAKPLIGVYIYGPVEGVEGVGFVGHGRRDAFAAVSLDDGITWKDTNLSESASLTSCDGSNCDIDRSDIPLFDDLEGRYPGDVVNIFQATAGNNALVVWPSRYCQGGSPNYALGNEGSSEANAEKLDAIAAHLGIDLDNPSPDDLYLMDMFGVAGSQRSVDYSEDKFEQNQAVGEVPFNCLWAARGTLVPGDDPRTDATESSYMRWFKAERLTSGRRDVNRVETVCVAGAGCAITWQEDPEGLRGGQGEGPGEGWSGAVANSQTDIWYSYISWEHFNLVEDPADGFSIISFEEYEELAEGDVTQKPQVGVPFAMPMRITDNASCNTTNPLPYCIGSAIAANFPDLPQPLDYGMVDMCADTLVIPAGKAHDGVQRYKTICVTEYGLPLIGNIAATRPRLGLFGYDSNADGIDDSAFAVVQAEESKGLGAFGFDDGGAPCNPETDEGCIAFDEGKNLWYYSFNFELMGDAAGNFAVDEGETATDELDSLLANLAGHGNQLNQPEVNWMTGEFYPAAYTGDLWGLGDYDYYIWNTEIARRGSLLAQDIAKVSSVYGGVSSAKSGLLAMPSWKQGIMNQGGPADVMVRRIILPKGWNVNALNYFGNPYAFRYMDCDTWLYGRDSSGMPENPYYPDGLCMDPAINLSASIPDLCINDEDGQETACPTVMLGGTTYGIGDTNPVLQGNEVTPNKTRVLMWHQCPAEFTTFSGETFDCDTDLRTDDSTLADQSWYNPLDVAKGHRGYLDGDFVMILYAWSPNWRLNAVGNDRYELYIRRSFDGGESWTTLPKNYKHWDGLKFSGAGTTTCETFRSEDTGNTKTEPVVCNEYGAGAAEQARNVTQHKSMSFTTLDPRYAPTAGSITADPFATGYILTDEDVRDPSRYAIVYETGDNRTAAEGEPEPLDLFYGRAVMFGDHYQVWAEETDLTVCYPSDPHEVDVAAEKIGSGFCNEFDQMEQGTPGLEASEASMEGNPGGEFIYGAWSQLQISDGASDAMVRRIHYIDDYIPSDAWIFGQGQTDPQP
jgi:hypothetical protein